MRCVVLSSEQVPVVFALNKIDLPEHCRPNCRLHIPKSHLQARAQVANLCTLGPLSSQIDTIDLLKPSRATASSHLELTRAELRRQCQALILGRARQADALAMYDTYRYFCVRGCRGGCGGGRVTSSEVSCYTSMALSTWTGPGRPGENAA